MSTRLHQLAGHGQRVWIDFLSRALFGGGDLERMLREDAVTANPAIFAHALAGGDAYHEQIAARAPAPQRLARRGARRRLGLILCGSAREQPAPTPTPWRRASCPVSLDLCATGVRMEYGLGLGSLHLAAVRRSTDTPGLQPNSASCARCGALGRTFYPRSLVRDQHGPPRPREQARAATDCAKGRQSKFARAGAPLPAAQLRTASRRRSGIVDARLLVVSEWLLSPARRGVSVVQIS